MKKFFIVFICGLILFGIFVYTGSRADNTDSSEINLDIDLDSPPPSTIRKVDLQKIKKMINNNLLSEKEALHYAKTEE